MVIPYSQNVVKDFFDKFGLPVRDVAESESGPRIVNPSLPTRCLAVLQARGRKANDAASFARIRNEVVELSASIPEERDKFTLFSVPEQQSLDEFFDAGNQQMIAQFGLGFPQLKMTDYSPIKSLPPAINLENAARVRKV